MTIASAPCSMCGHHASMLRRMKSRASLLRVEVERHRAAAAGRGRGDEADAEAVEHARGGGVGRRRERRLHAAFEHEHAPRVRPAAATAAPARSPAAPCARSFAGRSGRASRPSLSSGPNSAGRVSTLRSAVRASASAGRAPHLLVDDAPADVEQAAVVHARRARGLARAAGEAAVEVELRLFGDRLRLRAPAS